MYWNKVHLRRMRFDFPMDPIILHSFEWIGEMTQIFFSFSGFLRSSLVWLVQITIYLSAVTLSSIYLVPASLQVCKAIIGLKGKFSFRFLNCYIGQPSKPVFVKLSSSSCLEPLAHPGKGTLPMPNKAGKLSSEQNGGYTRLKGPFQPAEG